MQYRKLGPSDVMVSEISLGSWLTYGVGVEKTQAMACVRKALDLGVTLFDTSNIYGRGAAESFLGEALRQRWYPYEQTVVMLLQAVFGKKGISRFSVGQISDLPEGRESLASAMLQVERTERVLKALWREQHQSDPNWVEQYRQLAITSNQVRHTALIILHNLLS